MLKYTLTIKISWGHCDPAKIVFYPNYFIWFDQSAHLLFDKAGDRKSTRLNSSHSQQSRMPSSA